MSQFASISSAVVSFFTYFQNLGATVDLPSVNLPSNFRNILAKIKNFINALLVLIPGLPAFDLRCEFVILCLGIPFVLDIFFFWFVSPILKTFYHILDLVAIALGVLFLVKSLKTDFTFGAIVICSICLGYLVLRVIVLIATRTKQEVTLNELLDDINNYFLSGIFPDMKPENNMKSLTDRVKGFSQMVEIQEPKIEPIKLTFTLLIALLLIGLSLWSIGVFPGTRLGGAAAVFMPYIGFPFGIILLIVFFLFLFKCGRNFIKGFKQFCKRWGLRLLMLFLQMLYIPIITALVSNIAPHKFGCGNDAYLFYDRVPPKDNNDPYWMFVNHTAVCTPCLKAYMSAFPQCAELCSGKETLRLMDADNLEFIRDGLTVTGGIDLFAIFAVMIGIPYLWYYITKKNIHFVRACYVFGSTSEIKWKAMVNRLGTTGIFLFQYNKKKDCYWSVWLMLIKFFVMVITSLAGRIKSQIIYALPILYLIVFIVYCVRRPYLYGFNNFLDALLYLVNAFFSFIPVLSEFGISIPQSIASPLSIVLLVIPFASIIICLFCRKDLFEKDDPTVVDEKAIEKLKKKHKNPNKLDEKNEENRNIFACMSELSPEDRRAFSKEYKKDMKFTRKIYAEFNSEWLDSMKNLKSKNIHQRQVRVNRDMLANRMNRMYQMIDVVIDGSTIEFLTKTLNIAVMFGAGAFGWYLGGIMANQEIGENVFCG